MALALNGSERKPARGLVTMQGNTYLITDEEVEKLRTAGLNDMITIDKAIIKVSTIGEIMDLDKFYATYPDQKSIYPKSFAPLETWADQISSNGGIGTFERATVNGRQEMIKGMKNFLAENPESPKAQALLELMESRFQ